jgi:hypothetical protein
MRDTGQFIELTDGEGTSGGAGMSSVMEEIKEEEEEEEDEEAARSGSTSGCTTATAQFGVPFERRLKIIVPTAEAGALAGRARRGDPNGQARSVRVSAEK